MTTLFVNGLCVIDASYLHPIRGLLGDSWLVDIELEGTLDHQGMVLDFGEVKKQVKRTIDETFDHKLLVPNRHLGLKIEPLQHRCELQFPLTSGATITHSAPQSAITLIDTDSIGSESLSKAIIDELRPILPDNVETIRLKLRHEQINGPFYHYSHGLKHHAGNCQRIAHGHRSRIEILKNGEPAPDLAANWAKRWQDIYIATETDLLGHNDKAGIRYCQFGYTANQGLFQLELPESQTYLIDTDSTVENLAQHIADTLKQEQPSASFRVYAYEGVDKGAIGIA
ncbi:MAG: 6-carboxytetrahydropterin synthase [Chromatiales bacterium]|nr:6-carboxytetrahydropterin synthase [Chromatiales bacterium]